jgi:hypothetical protein
MAIKLLEFTPDGESSLSVKIINFADCPGGISYTQENLSPVFPRRTMNGSLITAQVRYNKKDFNVTLGIHSKELKAYFQTLFEEGLNAGFKIWSENETTYVPEAEFDGTVRVINVSESTDQQTNQRTLTLTILEV